MLTAVVVASTLLLGVQAHIALEFPPPITLNDFMDNARSTTPCGMSTTTASSALWKLQGRDGSSAPYEDPVTDLKSGSHLNVSWLLHYPHQGGHAVTLIRHNNSELVLESTMDRMSYNDGTQRSAMVQLPDEECLDCIIQFRRQALEFSPTYVFHSCARVNLRAETDACNGCSAHGTCNSAGKCECDKMFYGEYCQNKNECEEDGDCGAHGKCFDIGATTPPAKQCYCEEGWFGQDVAGEDDALLAKRTCDTASVLSLDDSADWATAYPHSVGRPGVLTVYWKTTAEYVEYAVWANTTSYFAFGLRPSGVAGHDFAMAAVPDSEGEGSQGEAEAEGEGEAEPCAEGEPCSEAEGEPCVDVEGEPCPACSESEGEPCTPEPCVDAEGEPCSEAEGEPCLDAEGEPCPACSESEGEPCTPEGESEAAACEPECEPESQAECTPCAGGSTNCTGVAPSPAYAAWLAWSEAEPEPESVRRLRALLQNDTASEPEPEGEAESEPESEGESEGEPGPGSNVVVEPAPEHGEGTCRTRIFDPSMRLHMMINQDIALMFARDNYFKIVDAFTPSRSTPRPDKNWGGSDDILDAVGHEADGVSLMKFRKRLSTGDMHGDYCIQENWAYDMIYAVGQVHDKPHLQSGAAAAQPFKSGYWHGAFPSALECFYDKWPLQACGADCIQPSDPHFYKPDELKYHGGGMDVNGFTSNSTFTGRGVFGTTVLIPSEPACTPSTLAEHGFECMRTITPNKFWLHWTLSDASIKLGGQTAGTGFAALGWGSGMVNAEVVIGIPSSASGRRHLSQEAGSVQTYKITAKSRNAITPQTTYNIAEPSVSVVDGKTVVIFSRSDMANMVGNQDMVFAFHESSADIAYHSQDNRGVFKISFADGTDNAPPSPVTAMQQPPSSTASSSDGTATLQLATAFALLSVVLLGTV
eukprot:CAMPEP_0114268900 /NCGR_PEP_ID=MMETSP0058-20121206/26268_1 /TAXON_ID=36894 /ORGANISM="Pyramimonas parkeae, CCMP726" /LENGTH=926 /DNA_ID=CAMNT_0001387235 /DNA_START=54 /DNA_END=2834 /DNA_ORIENTATION=+